MMKAYEAEIATPRPLEKTEVIGVIHNTCEIRVFIKDAQGVVMLSTLKPSISGSRRSAICAISK